jgi:tetratricopeptide (TPR) repeat protein
MGELTDLDPIFAQIQSGDTVGAAYRLVQEMKEAPGRMFYEVGSLALGRREELGESALRFARIAFAEAVERDPELGEAHHDLATTMRELGMAQDAVGHYRRALELMPGDVDSLIGLGAAQCDAGQLDEGIETLERAVHEHPDSGHAFANLGLALEAAGHDRRAVAAYASAVRRFDAALADAEDDEDAADAAARRRWGRMQHAALLERIEEWALAVVEYRRLYEEEQALAEAEEEAELAEAEAEEENPPPAPQPDSEAPPPEPLTDGSAGETLLDTAGAHEIADQPTGDLTLPGHESEELDEDEHAGRLGLERVFARLVALGRHDLAYLVLDDLGGEISDQRTRATYTIYDPGDGLPTIMLEHWDDGRRERLTATTPIPVAPPTKKRGSS